MRKTTPGSGMRGSISSSTRKPKAVRTVCRHLIEDRDHHRIVIDPAEANSRAIRCYEAVGFRRVGVLRRYWWDHAEQSWADGLLLDLLADDLT